MTTRAENRPTQQSPPMPDELNPRHLRARLLQLAFVLAVVIAVVVAAPGLGQVRDRLGDASGGWLGVGAILELLSALSYVVIFRAVFCPRMSWRMSYQIGMAEQAANALLPAGGAGGLALGVWALRRGGIPAAHIARRTVAFFLLTSLANFGALIVFAIGFAVGILGHDPQPAVTYAFGAGAVVAVVFIAVLPAWTDRIRPPSGIETSGIVRRLGTLLRRGLRALGDGIRDSGLLLRQQPLGVFIGSVGYMAFDIAVLWACYRAFGHSPSLGVIVVAYIIGQLGGLLPIPGGIGGTEGGLIGVFALYHAPLAISAVAILVYRAIQLWLPALLGSLAFVQLRNTLRTESAPALLCQPLSEQLETVELPVAG